MHHADLLSSIALSIVAATVLAFVARSLRQPLLLAYLVAGVVIGPEMGFAWIQDQESIELISEIGLILLLFIIGLEIDLKKLIVAGSSLLLTGGLQFPFCVAIGMPVALIMGMKLGGGHFDGLYLAVCLALSSTMIAVKLLYDKFELMTLPGRITLGVLVFQDIWAIIFLALQPNLTSPSPAALFESVVKGVGLVFISLAASRYVLPSLFARVAKIPELMLIASLAWCFLISGAAASVDLSREMGALIAGVSMSTFPYNVDVIAKVINIRDFFVTLFFVALGMKIPRPTATLITQAIAASLFLVVSRLVVVFPILYYLRNGLRVSLVPAINLAQMSEFSLVIASLGLSLKHIQSNLVGVLTFVFAVTSVASTYLITYNHEIQGWLSRGLKRLGVHDLDAAPLEPKVEEDAKGIVILGFFRDASSIIHELERESEDGALHPVLEDVLVIDFNPEVHRKLNERGIRCQYGDIASMDTLHHAQIHSARIVISTIPDTILKGTDNLKIMRQARRLCPHAQVVLAADTIDGALELYEEGADFVYLPRLHSARDMARKLTEAVTDGFGADRETEIEDLKSRKEVLP